MPRGLFVTGTDTGVGKTVVAAALLRACRTRVAVRYWKPIQTGSREDDDTAVVAALAECQPDEIRPDGVRLPHPVSPHLAAALSGCAIELPPLLDVLRAAGDGRHWIVEGAGGVLVPINEAALMVDLIAGSRLPAVVVARTALGTINHTLLTLEALGRRQVAVVGVILVGRRDADARAAIERYGGAVVLAEIPTFEPLTPAALAGWAVRLEAPALWRALA